MANASDEYEHISTALNVEQLEENLYLSKSLWYPLYSRGPFGGQVIAQALVSATDTVDSAFILHSLHCYFINCASVSAPIAYHVDRLREGRSYVTRSVKGMQNGQSFFVLLCSFQRPEWGQPTHAWPMPTVPPPEECELETARLQCTIDRHKPGSMRTLYETMLKEFLSVPILSKPALEHDVAADGTVRYMYWLKARDIDIPKYDDRLQKCILSYISDLYFLATASFVLGLKPYGDPDAGSIFSLDHAMWFYNNDFDCGDWLLYVMEGPSNASGRGMAQGRIYTRTGVLVAVTAQEGVVRAKTKGPAQMATSKL